jgi:hypothetical protein
MVMENRALLKNTFRLALILCREIQLEAKTITARISMIIQGLLDLNM